MSSADSRQYVTALTVGKQSLEVEVSVENLTTGEASGTLPRYRVQIGSEQSVVEARRFDERGNVASWSLIDQAGQQRLFDVDGSDKSLRISVAGGEPIVATLRDQRDLLLNKSSGPASGSGGDLRAAMPGKVVKLLCQVGDSVKAGQGLLVIEAMKMENELRAAIAGRVTALAVQEGQTVEAGQSLVTVSAQ
jgi:biotin carboxyl carrier protein